MIPNARAGSVITSSTELAAASSSSSAGPAVTKRSSYCSAAAESRGRSQAEAVRGRSTTRIDRQERLRTKHDLQLSQHSTKTNSSQLRSKRRTNDLLPGENVTRDSMVDNLLLSFNDIPHGQGPYSTQAPHLNSFEPGRLLSKIEHYRSSSPSSATSSLDDDNEDDLFSPRYSYYHSPTTTRLLKAATRSALNTPNRRLRRTPASSISVPTVWHPEDFQSSSRTLLHQEADRDQDMGLTERWHSRRSRSNSVTLSSYFDEGHRLRPSTSTTLANGKTRAGLNGEASDHDHPDMKPTSALQTRAYSSAMASRRPSIAIDNLAIDNFKQQVSSRDKIATLTGPTNVLAENASRRIESSSSHGQTEATSGSDSIVNSRAHSPMATTPTKERPGFFRRMFGSSRSSLSTERQPSPMPAALTTQAGAARKSTSKQYSSQMIYLPSGQPTEYPSSYNSETASTMSITPAKPTLLEPPPIPDDETASRPTLKQRASFFRRRRKAALEREPLPVVGDNSPQIPDDFADVSDMNSLRKVIDPLLVTTDATQAESSLDENNTSGLGLLISPPTPSRLRMATADSSSTSSAPAFRVQPASTTSPPRQENPGPDAVKSSLGVPAAESRSRSVSSSSSNSASEYATVRQPEYTPALIGTRFSQTFTSTSAASITLDQESPLSPLSPMSTDIIPPTTDAIGLSSNTLDLPLHDPDRPVPPSRIWLRPSQESVHLHSLPSLPSMELSRYSTPPTQHESPAISDECTPTIQTLNKPADLQQDDPAAVDFGEPLDSTVTTSARSAALSITPSTSGLVDLRDVSVAELGSDSPEAEQRLRMFMESFDLTGFNPLQALRHLCGRLALKGETSQLDRILIAFSQRWCDCNANHGFKSEDVVHTILYALLMLNTDLHSADNSQKMTRSQFTRNALQSIMSFTRADFDRDATVRANCNNEVETISPHEPRTPSLASDANLGRPILDHRQSQGQLPLRPRPTSAVPSFAPASPFAFEVRSFENVALVNAPFDGPIRAWESQVEGVLKDFYASIQQKRLPLFNDTELSATKSSSTQPPLTTSASSPTMLRRSGSVMSKAVSERSSGRMPDFRTWQAKSRSKPKLPAIKNSSARTSIEDMSSVWSPSASSTWSRGFGSAAMSSDTLATHVTSADRLMHHAPGFANAIQHAAVKETMNNSNESEIMPDDVPLLEDETLALAGAPWSKEGIVHHKIHYLGSDKKSKKSKWEDCFAVVEKGNLSTFSFTSHASVRNQKHNAHRSGPVGGGNWTESAQALCAFPLRHSISNIMPPPGYSKARPFAFALTLYNGNVHLFQVGTPEIAREFVSTANYWAARLSKEPLGGGVSNIEYGWSDAILSATLHEPASVRRTSRASSHLPRSFDQHSRPNRVYLGDRANITDWTPPAQSNSHSTLSETEQLQALKRYINEVEHELQVHNELRPAMMGAYATRSANEEIAMKNWERKSSYLLSQSTRFREYVEILEWAGKRRGEVLGAREEREEEMKRARGGGEEPEGVQEGMGGSEEGVGLGLT